MKKNKGVLLFDHVIGMIEKVKVNIELFDVERLKKETNYLFLFVKNFTDAQLTLKHKKDILKIGSRIDKIHKKEDLINIFNKLYMFIKKVRSKI